MTKRQTSYLTGFLFSLGLTIIAFELVSKQLLSGFGLAYAVLALALVQFCAQLVYFLHLSEEPRPHWNLQIFVSAFLLILLVIISSLWIMNSLKYRHANIEDDTNYILKSEGIGK